MRGLRSSKEEEQQPLTSVNLFQGLTKKIKGRLVFFRERSHSVVEPRFNLDRRLRLI